MLQQTPPPSSSILNHTGLKKDAPLFLKHDKYTYPTNKECSLYDMTTAELYDLFAEQDTLFIKELDIFMKFGAYNKRDEQNVRKQYSIFYFYNGFAYVKDELIMDANRIQSRKVDDTLRNDFYQREAASFADKTTHSSYSQDDEYTEEDTEDSTDMDEYDETYNPAPPRSKKKLNIPSRIGISVQSIRDITGFSYTVVPEWSDTGETVFIGWQKVFMEADEDIVVVDGSRQMGKSISLAEKLSEESFIPGKHMMVCAFLQETTNHIKNYLLEHISPFEDGTFSLNKRENFILNEITGVRIYFRTLANKGTRMRGYTLRFVVIDEAQEVPRDVYDLVLRPTLSTTGGRTILIGTPCENKTNVMYTMLNEIKMGQLYNNPGQKTAKYITVSANDNPLIAPKERREILDKQNDPKVQREYFNKWGKLEDSLFQLKEIGAGEAPSLTSGCIILSYDPARKKDRSAYSVLYCNQGRSWVIESGEVPLSMKDEWKRQADFHKEVRGRYEKLGIRIVSAMDVTGIGDGACEIWKGCGLPVDYKIRYVAGNKEGDRFPIFGQTTVSKSALINNLVDLIEAQGILCIRETNGPLIDEITNISLSENKGGTVSLNTSFFDDITNALMIGAYVAVKYRLIHSGVAQNVEQSTTGAFDIYVEKDRIFREIQSKIRGGMDSSQNVGYF